MDGCWAVATPIFLDPLDAASSRLTPGPVVAALYDYLAVNVPASPASPTDASTARPAASVTAEPALAGASLSSLAGARGERARRVTGRRAHPQARKEPRRRRGRARGAPPRISPPGR